MALTTVRGMLENAQKGAYAIAAFNVENMEMAQAVIFAAEELCAPVIVQTTSGTLQYASPGAFAGMVSRLARDAKIPVALHLDHGNSYELCEECIREGYTSVMIDGSLLPFNGNVSLTRRVVAMAYGLPVEAELGTVGGKEDHHEAGVQYTDPREAAQFVRETGVFSFAPAIGTAHGIYKAEPKLDLVRLQEIGQAVSVPLVLHGTSGVPHEMVRACIERGVCKVNYATELRIAFSDGVRQALSLNPGAYDPKKYLAAGRDVLQGKVKELIRVCGCDGKASV